MLLHAVHPLLGCSIVFHLFNIHVGTNACYTERLANVPKFAGDRTKYEYVVINMEWGGFGTFDSDGKSLLDPWLTQFDRHMDTKDNVTNPGKQM